MPAESATQVPGDPTRQSEEEAQEALGLLCFGEAGAEKGFGRLKGHVGCKGTELGVGEKGDCGVHGGEGGHGARVHGNAGAKVHRVTSAYMQRRNERFILNL